MLRFFKRLAIVLGVILSLLLLMQLVPYGRDHTNPPGSHEPEWDSKETRALVVRACFDCHSNKTTWPWYSHVAPMSWVVQRHVDEARLALNFSDWSQNYYGEGQAAMNVIRGDMPPLSYWLFHPEARLTHEEKLKLAHGLQDTFGLPSRD